MIDRPTRRETRGSLYGQGIEALSEGIGYEPRRRIGVGSEKLPEFKAEMEQLKDLREEFTALVGEEKAGELITAARGADVPIYEYCYRAGLEDGIRLSGMIERLKKS